MSIAVKVCGLRTAEAFAAAREGEAAFVGFIFYPPSPRYLPPEEVRDLTNGTTNGPCKVGVVVNLSDAEIEAIVKAAPLDMLQLHGSESPERVAEVKARFGLPVMKAIAVAGPDDIARAEAYLPVADRLLFDAKPPKDLKGALPGGNALSFDWQLLAGRDWPLPWMLSGGLTVDNLAEAVRIARARAVDVSSGVEDRPGEKNPAKIAALLERARTLEPVS